MPDLVGVAPRCKLNAKLELFYRVLDSFDGAERLRANMGALLTLLAVSEGWARVEVEYKKMHTNINYKCLLVDVWNSNQRACLQEEIGFHSLGP